MLISNILFFIECAEQLRPSYNNKKTTNKQKKQLATFLKTWIWYNSHSEEIFWTGLYTEESKKPKRVKEHWYSNLTTAEYLLKKGIDKLRKKDQINWIFERMRWNYASRKQNIDLITKQKFDTFYNEFDGNPKLAYKSLGIKLKKHEKSVFSEKIKSFILKKRKNKSSIIEIGFTNNEHKNFKKGLNNASNALKTECELFEISNKNLIIESSSFSQLFKTMMSGLWALMNEDELLNFIDEHGYGYENGDGPFRKENNFSTQKHRVFSVKTKNRKNIFMTTYNNNGYKYALLNKLAEYLDIELTFFDFEFNEITY